MILIVCMKSWGEFGNFLAAKQLQAFLTKTSGQLVDLIAGDDYIDNFVQVGQDIKMAVKSAANSDEVFDNYLNIVTRLDHRVAKQTEEQDFSEYLPLLEAIEQRKPTTVICTKGVVARMLAAQKIKKMPEQLYNYVTNHGHFSMDVHRSAIDSGMKYLTRLPAATEYLRDIVKVPATQIHDFGYISSVQMENLADTQQVSELTDVILVSNRGGRKYTLLYQELLKNTNLNLHYIVINDAEELAVAEQSARDYPGRAKVLDGLQQKDFLALVAELGKKGTVYVGKGSINTLIEAVLGKQPVLGLRSGLPMEEWGAQYLEQHQLGCIRDDWKDIYNKIAELVDSPQAYCELRTNVLKYLAGDSINLRPNLAWLQLPTEEQKVLGQIGQCKVQLIAGLEAKMSEHQVEMTDSAKAMMNMFVDAQLTDKVVTSPEDLVLLLQKLNIEQISQMYIEEFGALRLTTNRTVRLLAMMHEQWVAAKQAQEAASC
ncbi:MULTISPECIES: hypothetical protein [unclassified Pseudoalteromonas]|uniref:hypothetical protein n=1 Tax=unclassified Pseudoalteromonas TaxID=194690 RepID=UPI001F38C259|nr:MULTISPECIES: hypothetical protein [unclassified Pseudoalteromonas]MCF2825424.1 hypothetical protein [Pseudoalteromonas sp. OF5H-5]MCF2833913.1 hypothetical protein [Pseudoalteromonas sp. DL2-H6]MCF2923197.1 hypothetical protein [Pseudoalteromonas sp. DL2-H1]MCG7553991.1 hypothetical protein [Pseudoalteromonas sp. Of11M-6]